MLGMGMHVPRRGRKRKVLDALAKLEVLQTTTSLSRASISKLLSILEHLSLSSPPRNSLMDIFGGLDRRLRWRAGADHWSDIGGLDYGRVNWTDKGRALDEPRRNAKWYSCY